VLIHAFCPSKQTTVLEAKRRIGIRTRSSLVVSMVLEASSDFFKLVKFIIYIQNGGGMYRGRSLEARNVMLGKAKFTFY
jgi:hypothetical protein